MSEIPIFLCGYPKSGTTLLTTLLDGHSQIVVFPEETFYLRKVANHPELTAAEGAKWLLTESHCKNLALGDFESRLDGNLSYSGFDFQAFQEQFLTKVRDRPQTHDHVLKSLIATYAEKTDQVNKRYWAEKSPLNEHRLHLPLAWYSDMRAIYMIRDPRDVYVSYARKKQIESDGQNTLPLETFMRHWAMSIWSWQQYAAANTNGLLIRYEDLARYPKETMALVCRFLDIPYETVLEIPTKNGKLWLGNSMYGDKFTGISTKPIGRWRERLSEETLTLMEAYLGKTMVYLGYQLATQPPSLFQIINYWLRHIQQKKQVLGVLLRLYWPFQLPGFLKRTTTL